MDIERPPDVIVIAGGAPVERAPWPRAATRRARVVAADAGVQRAIDLGLEVDVAVGDFDSLAPEVVDHLDDLAAEVRRHPADKDATDLELALAVAAEWGPARVLVIGVEGGRPDHALANLLLAGARRFAALDLELFLEHGRVWVVRHELTGVRGEGDLFSVLPVHGDAVVSITGVRWPLDRAPLVAGTTHGVSNEAAGGPLTVTVHAGTVLCIAPRPPDPDNGEVRP